MIKLLTFALISIHSITAYSAIQSVGGHTTAISCSNLYKDYISKSENTIKNLESKNQLLEEKIKLLEKALSESKNISSGEFYNEYSRNR